MGPLALPLVLSAAVAGLLLASRETATSAAKELPPAKRPPDDPIPVVPGAPNAALLAQYQALLAQAVANPGSVDPAALAALAAQLQASGLGPQAAQLQGLLLGVCAARGMTTGVCAPMGPITAPRPTTATTPPNPDIPTDPAAFQARLHAMAKDQLTEFGVRIKRFESPKTFDLTTLDGILGQMEQNGFVVDAAALRPQLAVLHVAQGTPLPAPRPIRTANQAPPPPSPNNTFLPADVATQIDAALDPANPTTTSVEADRLASVLQMSFGGNFADKLFRLQKRAADLRTLGR